MHRRRRPLTAATLLAVTALTLAGSPASASAANRQIKISSAKTILSVGGFRPADDASVGAAVAVFGPPTSVSPSGDAGCDIRWSDRGLRIVFANFGEPGRSACEAGIGQAQFIRIGGTKAAGWHTNRKLYIGATRHTMRKKYNAHRTGRGRYSLLRKRSIYGPPGSTDEVLGARISKGRVSSFILTPLAAGD